MYTLRVGMVLANLTKSTTVTSFVLEHLKIFSSFVKATLNNMGKLTAAFVMML